MPDVIEAPDVVETVVTQPNLADPGDRDPDELSHYCDPADIEQNMLFGRPLIAFCGYRMPDARRMPHDAVAGA